MAVTISDVAKEAGVSTSTVSKVLNNWSSISQETCDRVHAAIQKLNYTPNARAVSFAKGRTNTIIFLSDLSKEQAYSIHICSISYVVPAKLWLTTDILLCLRIFLRQKISKNMSRD